LANKPYTNELKFGINDNMPSIYANTQQPPMMPMEVVFVVYPNIVLLDLVGPLQVFTHARRNERSDAAYRTHVVSLGSERVQTNTVVSIDTGPISKWIGRPIHTLVVVGGDGAIPASQDPSLVNQVSKLAGQSERVCSVCSGALVLAATGLLDGRRAVTHWEDCGRLAETYPDVEVEIDPIYIKDGHVWTSAGITAGIDMALAIVAEDIGRPAAIEMARSMVTHMVRPGGQAQFSPVLDRQARDGSNRFSELHDWIGANIHLSLSVDDMAEHCGMSSRNFSRLYTAIMGSSPAKALENIRVDTAREFLETTDLSIKQVAAKCGFKDDERMRRAFLRNVRVPPSQYKEQFRQDALIQHANG